MQQIQSRLDSLQEHQAASSDAKAIAEIHDALDAVKSLPEMSAALIKLTRGVTQLGIGMSLFSFFLLFSSSFFLHIRTQSC